MKNFKISENQGYAYSLESGDKNKIHLDELTGYNSIYNHKIVYGILIFLKFIKELNYKKLKEYTIEIEFIKGFKYNVPIQLKNHTIFQKNAGEAKINFLKKKIEYKYKSEKLKLIKTINLKNFNSSKRSSYEKIRVILNHLSWYVGMVNPGNFSLIIADINLMYSSNFIKSKKINIYSKKVPKFPIIINRITYDNFIVEFTTVKRPHLKNINTKINKQVKQLVLNTKIPVLILGASSGIGKEILDIYKYNKNIKIISTYNKNRISLKQKNVKIIKLEIKNIIKKLKLIFYELDKLRIYYFFSPKILLSKNNSYNIKEYTDFYINIPKKIISLVPKNFYLEFFYPSTIFIDEKIDSDYTNSKIIAEKNLNRLKKSNINVNILRIDKINTKQSLSLINQKLPSFIEKLNTNQKYRQKVFFLKKK